MTLLYLGILLLAGPHLVSSLAPGFRNRLKARFGQGAFRGVYSLITLLGLILVAWAYFATRESGEMVYAPSGSLRHATMGLATLGMILIAAGHGKSHLRLWVKQPFSIGITLWAMGHMLSVGKTAAFCAFAAFLLIAVIDVVVSTLRGKVPDYQPVWRSDLIAVVAGLVLTALLVGLFHPYVLGVNPLH